jgi:hypothetical protein
VCPECGEVFEAPEEFAELVQIGAVECAAFDREWRSALALAEL